MKFLVDMMLSTKVAEELQTAGHDAVTVWEYGMQRASDEDILTRAAREQGTLISADMDLAPARVAAGALAGVLVLRRLALHLSESCCPCYLANLADRWRKAAFVVIERNRIAFGGCRSAPA